MSKTLKILFLNNSDTNGGAARAAYRLFVELRTHGIEVKMLVRNKTSNDSDVISCLDLENHNFIQDTFLRIKRRIDKHKWKKYPDRENVFLNDLSSISLLKVFEGIDFDILHLHFVANRFLDLSELKKINKPIVWTLHDSWSFTGICHFFYNCERYKVGCGACPMLHSNDPKDFTYSICKIKKDAYSALNLHIVSPSKWLGECARESSLLGKFPITIIPNGIDTTVFKPMVRNEAILALGLDESKSYLLFGAVNATTDLNKGFLMLLDALNSLSKHSMLPLELLVYGADKLNDFAELDLPIRYLGFVNNTETLVQLNNAADVMVIPSKSENLSNAILESLSCGTPVVAFDIGGNSDMIDHKQNGYLAKAFDCADLAYGISWCLENNSENNLSISARNKVEECFGLDKVSEKYYKVYDQFV